jgi:uncharacterized membrane protein YiaA
MNNWEYKFAEICKKLDEASAKLSAIRRYNANTALITMYLWGIGLPLVLFGSVFFAIHR